MASYLCQYMDMPRREAVWMSACTVLDAQAIQTFNALHETYLDKRPIAKHTAAAFQTAAEFARSRNTPLIIDAGCGTGRSTLKLAERYPDRTVIGVDRSEARLSKSRDAPANALLLRAELGDFWRLLNATPDLTVEETYLLYPNPYPKTKMLKVVSFPC